MNWELALGLLAFAILLACPLHMWWMMRHRSDGQSCGGNRNVDGDASKESAAESGREEQDILVLKERIAKLEAEQRQAKEMWK